MTKPQPSIDHRLPDGTLTIRLLPGSLAERLAARFERKLRKQRRPKGGKK